MADHRRPAADPPFRQRQAIVDALGSLGVAADEAALERIARFVRLLLQWNRTYNLTGARDEPTLVREHLIDCLAIIPVIETRITIDQRQGLFPLLIDVGSGAGFPGLVIAALRPQWPIALVEPISKKAAFLTQAIATLRLPHARSLGRRLEAARDDLLDMTPDLQRATWHFTCRAVAATDNLVSLVKPLARPGSRLFAMKGPSSESSVEPLQVSTHLLSVPGQDKQRTLVEVLLMDGSNAVPALNACSSR